MADQARPRPTTGAKIDYLFEHRRRADGKRYTYSQVEAVIASYGGATVGGSYLCRLRKHPDRHLDLSPPRRAAVARFFRVDPAYFDSDCPVDAPPWLELAAAAGTADDDGTAVARDELGLKIYARGLGMSPMEQTVWLKMAEVARQIVAESGLSADRPTE
ncbi:MAG: hypothetical protein ACRDQI_00340 [Pseudonocardiaceae bacterium]